VLKGAQARLLKRKLSLRVATMSQWWVRRSSRAAVCQSALNGFHGTASKSFHFSARFRMFFALFEAE
jgi:hypothetical protein